MPKRFFIFLVTILVTKYYKKYLYRYIFALLYIQYGPQVEYREQISEVLEIEKAIYISMYSLFLWNEVIL